MRRSTVMYGVAILMLTLLTSLPGAASDSDWKKIGSKEFNAKNNEASMRVGVEDGFFRWLKFGAQGGKINLKKVTVHFSGGKEEVFDNFVTIKDGGETRVVPIAGVIKKAMTRIEFEYEIKGDAKKVKVTTYGRRDKD